MLLFCYPGFMARDIIWVQCLRFLLVEIIQHIEWHVDIAGRFNICLVSILFTLKLMVWARRLVLQAKRSANGKKHTNQHDFPLFVLRKVTQNIIENHELLGAGRSEKPRNDSYGF